MVFIANYKRRTCKRRTNYKSRKPMRNALNLLLRQLNKGAGVEDQWDSNTETKSFDSLLFKFTWSSASVSCSCAFLYYWNTHNKSCVILRFMSSVHEPCSRKNKSTGIDTHKFFQNAKKQSIKTLDVESLLNYLCQCNVFGSLNAKLLIAVF